MSADPGRGAELAARLAAVRVRIDRACTASGRPREGVHLVVVTKYFPASDVEALAGLGVAEIGESRDQEASAKVDELRAMAAEPASPLATAWPTVHFVGQLQTKKASSVARYADVVHSLDRPKLAAALDDAAARAGRVLDVLVQVSLDGDVGRGGVTPERAGELADAAADLTHLRLRGVMAVAPRGAEPLEAFATLAAVADGIRSSHPGASWISAGMSGDLEQAVAIGATHLRVGSAILGSRPPLR